MRLTPDQHATLYACVSAILHERKGELNSAADVSASLGAVASVTHAACAEFALSMNHASTAQVFPDEALSIIFSFLDFAGRIRASQVCHMWRRVSLGNPSLWTDIVVPRCTPSPIDAMATLRCFELLHRSNPMPFHLVLDAPGLLDGSMEIDSAVVALMKRHIGRLASYRGPQNLAVQSLGILETSLPRLQSLSLPQTSLPRLQSFSLPRPEDLLRIPSHWSGEGAPHLSRLEVGSFSFASACRPFRVLQHFSGRLWGDGAAAEHLFRLFPRLKSLELHVEPMATLPTPPLPASLHSLAICSGMFTFNTARLTPLIPGSALRQLSVNKAENVEPLVGWFASLQTGAFSMFSSSSELVLAGADDFAYTAVVSDFRSDFRGLAPHLMRLERLALEGCRLWDLCHGGLSLPNVRALQIIVREHRDAASWPAIVYTAPGAGLPALQRLDLAWLPRSEDRAEATVALLVEYFPQNLKSYVVYDALVLQSVTLTLSVDPPGAPDFGALAALAEEFVVLRRYDLGYDPAEYVQLQDFPAEPLVLRP